MKIKVTKVGDSYKCDLCGKIMSMKAASGHFVLTHYPKNKIKCGHCNLLFTEGSCFNQHVKVCVKSSSGGTEYTRNLKFLDASLTGSNPVSSILFCAFCGGIAKHILKKGKLCCCKSLNSCPKMRKNNSDKIKELYRTGKMVSSFSYCKPRRWWEIKSEDEVKAIRKRQGETFSKTLSAGLHKENKSGYKNVKYYKIFSQYENKIVVVHGLYELNYAIYLNSKNIMWSNDRKYSLKYKNIEEDKIRYYYPDFYLSVENKYIEIKGKWVHGNKDARIKMISVRKCNPNVNIEILTHIELKQLNLMPKYVKNENKKYILQIPDEIIKLNAFLSPMEAK